MAFSRWKTESKEHICAENQPLKFPEEPKFYPQPLDGEKNCPRKISWNCWSSVIHCFPVCRYCGNRKVCYSLVKEWIFQEFAVNCVFTVDSQSKISYISARPFGGLSAHPTIGGPPSQYGRARERLPHKKGWALEIVLLPQGRGHGR